MSTSTPRSPSPENSSQIKHLTTPSDPEYRTLTTPVGELAITDVGAGAPVLAVHGMPGTVRDFRYLGALLEPHLRFIRLDLPGFGASPPRLPPTRAGYVEAIVRALDALGLERAVLLSHSFGSGMVLSVAAEAPTRVAGLALLAPTGLRPNRGMKRFPVPPRVLEGALATPGLGRVLGRRLEPGFRAMGFRCTEAEARRSITTVARWRFAETRAAVQALRCPVFGAWTDDDHAVEPAIVTELLDHLPPGPRLGFATGGHNLQKSRAAEIAEALIPWVNGLHLPGSKGESPWNA